MKPFATGELCVRMWFAKNPFRGAQGALWGAVRVYVELNPKQMVTIYVGRKIIALGGQEKACWGHSVIVRPKGCLGTPMEDHTVVEG